jgi:hypothetical protein
MTPFLPILLRLAGGGLILLSLLHIPKTPMGSRLYILHFPSHHALRTTQM